MSLGARAGDGQPGNEYWRGAAAAFEWETRLPLFRRVRQQFPRPLVADLPAAVAAAMEATDGAARLGGGKRVAITAGSRGISRIPEILAAVVARVRHYGGNPFLVPAMGSHGRATAEGQLALLAELGITEASVGAPIESSLEVVELGKLPEGMPVYQDCLASQADAIVVVNRVKPHTNFTADIESGLAKMIVIGLGKRRGADTVHRHGLTGMTKLLPQAARLAIQRSPIAMGLAILENAYDEVADIVPLAPSGIGAEEEAKLLVRARKLMPCLPFEEIDALIVDELGKNISGAGLDPNILGRLGSEPFGGPDRPVVHAIAVLGITPESHGNAIGVGLADVTTRRVVEQIDFEAMYINGLTAGSIGLRTVCLPVIAPDDLTAVLTALRVCGRPDPQNARVVRLKNTLALGEMDVSENLLGDPLAHPSLTLVSEPFALPFDAGGRLRSFEEAL